MKKLNVNLIRASVLAALIALSAMPASADTFSYSSGLFGGFDRPNAGVPPTSLSGIIVPFNAQGFMVSLDGTYNFTLTADLNSFVPVLVLYENSFDASTPLSNALIAIGPPFSFDLSAGTTYIIVPTRTNSGLGGVFHGTISGPGEITPVGGVIIPEPTTMLLLGTGLAGVAVKIRKNKRRES
ncbi:MAG TPA: PEP-CTERM sorting domain-containing protein [Pyrinomonadaceae bacterium]|nr:PEP-CTERM sorting domain-containing protein [Pyrinomonadaceae bacterium]